VLKPDATPFAAVRGVGHLLRGRIARGLALLLAVTVLLVLVPVGGSAAGPILTPVADTWVEAANPVAAHGGETALRTDADPVQRSYVRFDVPEGTVAKATLRVHARSANLAGYSVHQVASTTWGENGTTYSSAPTVGTLVAQHGSFGSNVWTSVDVTSAVAGPGPVSFALVARNNTAVNYASREGAALAPQLVLDLVAPAGPTHTPTPTPTPTRAPTVTPTPTGGAAPKVAAVGDIACDPTSVYFNGGQGAANNCAQQRTSDLVLAGGPAAVLPLGDVQYEQGTLAQFMASYEPSWGRLKDVTRPAVGNHEYLTAGAAGYFDYFNGVGSATGPAGDRSKGYYAFDVGSWRLYAVNSNCSKVACGAGSAQEQWLRADLAANPRSCVLAYWHHPRWSSGQHGSFASMGPIYQALHEAGAELVLAGHDHNYERFEPLTPAGVVDPDGLRSFVVGGGGRNHYAVGAPVTGSLVRNADTYGVLFLTLRPDGYDWEYVPEPGKTFRDSGSGTCR
jgi:hypothetical protein